MSAPQTPQMGPLNTGEVVPAAPAQSLNFAAPVNFAVGTNPNGLYYDDVNNDGFLDIATANTGANSVSVLLGAGNTFGSATSFPTGASPYSVTIADATGDSIRDLLTANYTANSVSRLTGSGNVQGNGQFGAPTTFSTGAGSGPRAVAVGQFDTLNNDFLPDLATANYDGNTVGVLLSNGSGGFAAPVLYSTGANSKPIAIKLGYFDAYTFQRQFLVTANNGNNTVSVLRPNDDGTFQGAVSYAVGAGPRALVLDDFNRDGYTDIATANETGSNVSVLLGRGDGTFLAATTYVTGSGPRGLAVEDFNNDGNLDLATANFAGNNVSVLLGNGNGVFDAPINFAAGTQPTALIAGFLADARPALLVANAGSNNVSLLNNTSPFLYNNNFSNALPISGSSGPPFSGVFRDSTGATKEAGEPNHAGEAGGASVWFKWTAPVNGGVSFTCTSFEFVCLVGAYTGGSVSTLTTVASGTATAPDTLQFKAQAGVSYFIAVDGRSGGAGQYALQWTQAANDDFVNARVIFGATDSLQDSNVLASKEVGEPNHAGNAGGASLWYKWQAPANGNVKFTTTGTSEPVDTLLAAYTGNSVSTLTELASNDNRYLPAQQIGDSRIGFSVVAGQTYYIAVDGHDGQRAPFSLSWALYTPPANDNFAAGQTISGATGSVNGSNVGAIREAGEPAHSGDVSGQSSIWYQWQAPGAGAVTFDTLGSSEDILPLLGAYTGASVNALTPVPDRQGPPTNIFFRVTAGTTYHIAVDGSNDSAGAIKLNWNYLPPPANDNFTAAQLLSGESGSVQGNNRAASKETGEPNHAGTAGGASLWYKWQAPATHSYTWTTAGSNFDTVLAVYTGSSLGTLIKVASNDDAPNTRTSSLSFSAQQGTTYYISVDGLRGATGDAILNWGPTPPPPVCIGLNGLVSWYPGENSAQDMRGGNNGVMHGTKITFSSGQVGRAFSLVSSSDYIEAPDSADNSITGALSLDVWLNPNRVDVEQMFVAKYDAALGQVSYYLRSTGTGNRLNFTVSQNGTTTTGNFRAIETTGAALTVGTWTHVAATFDPATQTMKLYVNGVEAATTLVSGSGTVNSIFDSAASLFIGAYKSSNGTPGSPYQGLLDEVGLYNRVLTASEVAGLAGSSTGRCHNDQFDNAWTLSGRAGLLTDDNSLATKQTGEPVHAGAAGGASLWYRWRAPANGTVTLSTIGSSFDTVLAVYTGTGVSALTNVGSNDDASGVESASRLSFNTVANTLYYIAVDGLGSARGVVKLRWSYGLSLGGHVNKSLGGAAVAANLTLSGAATGTAVTDGNGEYIFGDLVAGSNYTITGPFNPASRSYNPLTGDITNADFAVVVAGSTTVTISTSILNGQGGGLSGITVKMVGDTFTLTSQTSVNGNVVFTNLPSGNYTVKPQSAAYTFSPESIFYGNLTKDTLGPNFVAQPSFGVGGQVLAGGLPLDGVSVTLSGANLPSVLTDANGYYSFDNLPAGGNYSVSPAKTGYTFTPQNLSFSNLNVQQKAANFTAAAAQSAPTISTLSPPSAVAGSAAFTLTINGADFVSGATVTFNGNNRTTTFVNSSQLSAQITAADIQTNGTYPVTVVNPAGGGTSNAVNFTATAPTALQIETVTPRAGRTSGGQQITLTGSFNGLSSVKLDGVTASIVSNSGSQVVVTTPAHGVGAVDIVLTDSANNTVSQPHGFAYLPTVFTDNTLMAGVTTAKAQHIIELRQAVDALRAVAGLAAAQWTDVTLTPTSSLIRAVDIMELRARLEEAAVALGYAQMNYTDPTLNSSLPIKRIHIEELRQRIRSIAG